MVNELGTNRNPLKQHWDHAYLFKLIELKLYLMERHFRYYTIIMESDAKQIIHQLRVARKLCRRLRNEEVYWSNADWEAEHRMWCRDVQRLADIIKKYGRTWWD